MNSYWAILKDGQTWKRYSINSPLSANNIMRDHFKGFIDLSDLDALALLKELCKIALYKNRLKVIQTSDPAVTGKSRYMNRFPIQDFSSPATKAPLKHLITEFTAQTNAD